LSYFAKPNFIIYDEWFDEDLYKKEFDFKNKEIKALSKVHEFYYQQSNYKVGASEKNLQLDMKISNKEINTNQHIKNPSRQISLRSNKKFWFFEKYTSNTMEFNITKKLIYSSSIFVFILIFGFLIYSNTKSQTNESNILYKSLNRENKF